MLKKARFRDNVCGIFLHIRTALCWLCRLRPRGNSLSSLFDIFSGLFPLNPSFLFVMICHLLVRYEMVENCISILLSALFSQSQFASCCSIMLDSFENATREFHRLRGV